VVLSTLHTNNAAGVIPRLIDMKVEPFLIPVSLNLVIAQRLLGTLCLNCKAPEDAPPQIVDVIRRTLKELPADITAKYPEPFKIYHAKGCPVCKGRGIQGRSQINEVFQMTPAMEDIVASGPTAQKIAEEAKRQGMITLRQDGVLKALDGLFGIEEVLRETEEA
jgi:type II secretory ATPase GspE/PulE/Tfp pilus assembly ATPase PilB-like protein